MPSSLEIAQARDAAADRRRSPAEIGLDDDEIELYGRYKAKVDLVGARPPRRPAGRRSSIGVTAITPTKAGEGKTTTVGRRSRRASARSASARCSACARRRSARCSGSRAARPAAATRRSSRWRTLNLHFTGDIHAIGAANNLLSAMLEAHILHGNELGDRPADGQLAPLRRHERPRAARRRDRPRRPRERLRPRDRLRHHRRLRGDGDRRGRARPLRPAQAARRDHRRATRGRASRSPPSS